MPKFWLRKVLSALEQGTWPPKCNSRASRRGLQPHRASPRCKFAPLQKQKAGRCCKSTQSLSCMRNTMISWVYVLLCQSLSSHTSSVGDQCVSLSLSLQHHSDNEKQPLHTDHQHGGSGLITEIYIMSTCVSSCAFSTKGINSSVLDAQVLLVLRTHILHLKICGGLFCSLINWRKYCCQIHDSLISNHNFCILASNVPVSVCNSTERTCLTFAHPSIKHF